MAVTIASLLTDFSAPAGGEPQGIGLLRSVKVVPVSEPEAPPPVVDRQAELIRSLEATVRAEEKETARKELEDAIAAEKARHEEDMNAQREIWVEQQAMQMSTQILETLGRIEAIISERAANVLKPFVLEAFRQKSLAELKEGLATLFFSGEANLIKIAGPEDLLSAMKSHLGSHASIVEFAPGEHVEVSVVVQDTTIQTRLNSWSRRLEQALEGW